MDNPTGKLALTFRRKSDGKTYPARQYFKLPLQIMPCHYQDQDGTAFQYLLNPGGGILQHDRLHTEITLEADSRALITTPSATKFYRMDEGHAEIDNVFRVAEGAVLEYLPEHNIPFAESRTYQRTAFHLHRDATLIAAEMVTAGRVSRGEVFGYDLYDFCTRIFIDGRLAVFDRGHIRPDNMNLQAVGMMESFLSHGTMYLYRRRLDPALPDRLVLQGQDFEDVRFGVTMPQDDLLIVRFLGNNIMDMQNVVLKVWAEARRTLLGKESVRIRKY